MRRLAATLTLCAFAAAVAGTSFASSDGRERPWAYSPTDVLFDQHTN